MKNILYRASTVSFLTLTMLMLMACSTVGALGAQKRPTSPYADYLSARFASAEADVQAAADFYSKAQQKDPNNPQLQQRAMLSAIFASDIKQAAKQARLVLQTNPDDRMAILILVAKAMADRKYNDVETMLSTTQMSPLNQVAGGLLQAWAAQGQGKTDEALRLLDETATAPVLGQIALFHKALVLTQTDQSKAAELAFEQALQSGILTSRTAYGWALKYLAEDDTAAMSSLLEQRLRGNADEIEAGFLTAKLASNHSLVQAFATPRQGAAEALFGPAQAFAERNLHDLAMIYLELALHIDPKHDAARNLLARLIAVQGRDEDALILFAKIDKDSPWYLQTALNRADTLIRLDRHEEAINGLRVLVVQNPTIKIKRALATALQVNQQYDEAFVLFSDLIEETQDNADWLLYFYRGVSLERTDRWREGVPDFRKAIELQPNQADVLNYLGYTFVDAGENLEEGFALIRRAIELAPTSGHIVDSLGWGYYRLGRFAEAVIELEKAVGMEPGDPTINDHLGDAYWQVGRRLEAKFQWQRVLTLEPDEETDLAKIHAKLKSGLPELPTSQLAQGR
ncbi:MAG: tetratricopeptide repeat protein [Robiginitomaculum sp.]|nr:tetratricopeptide repeat protein [Robiginitomaculum sp.]